MPRNEFSGGRLALDFCNTLSRGPGKGPRDRLGQPDLALDWAKRSGWELDGVPVPAELAALHDFRAALVGLFDRLSEGEAPDPRHVDRLNTELASAGASQGLAPAEGGRWRMAERAGNALMRLRHAIARDAALLLTGEPERIKRCPAHDCLWLFHDSSKNRSRRWCAMDECGSRAKMRRHRARGSF